MEEKTQTVYALAYGPNGEIEYIYLNKITAERHQRELKEMGISSRLYNRELNLYNAGTKENSKITGI